MNKVSDYTM